MTRAEKALRNQALALSYAALQKLAGEADRAKADLERAQGQLQTATRDFDDMKKRAVNAEQRLAEQSPVT